MTLGEKIKLYRNKLNLSQEEFAKKCTLSRNAIYNYENNKRSPTIAILLKIAEGLDIDTSELLENSDNVNTYENKLEFIEAIEKDMDTIYVEEEKSYQYDLEMNELDMNKLEINKLEINELYNKYFFDLFNWKTIKMDSTNYFKFVLSLCPLDEIKNFTEEDLNELSILFCRFVTLKSHERNAINEKEKIISGKSKYYEKNNFLTIRQNK